MHQKPEQVFDSSPPPQRPARTADSREGYDGKANRILRAATDLIAQAGYQRASMRAIARAAGVSLAGLYHYFDGKERMLFLIQFRTFSSLLNNLREKLLGVDDPVEQLHVMVRAHVTYFAANMAALKVCSHELDSLTGPAFDQTRRIRHDYYEATRAILDRILDAADQDTPLDRHVATMSLFGTLNWLYRWYDPTKSPTPNTLAKQITNQCLTGILSRAPGPTIAESSPRRC